jgi:hypothetical protein
MRSNGRSVTSSNREHQAAMELVLGQMRRWEDFVIDPLNLIEQKSVRLESSWQVPQPDQTSRRVPRLRICGQR